jgi:hypothetical protein
MKFISSKNKGNLTILILVFTLLAISPGFTTLIPESQISPNNNLPMTSQAVIQDGLIINYTMGGIGGDYDTGLTYNQVSAEIYNVSWWIEGTGTSTWQVNKTSRLLTNGTGTSNFDDGSHSPIWIFTTASISDIILISCDGMGDFPHEVTKEFIFNFPGFGAIEVWQLDNLIIPIYSACYEKSTGLLIKGTFPVFATNYTLEMTGINTNLNYVEPISGVFDGLYIHHNFSLFPSPPTPSNFTFHEFMPDVYNVTWTGGPGIWSVELSSRITIYALGPLTFGSGYHDPSWIHTNVSLNDLVPIAIDGVGDFAFQVTGELIHNLVSFGPIEVWILEEPIFNSTVWYEKSTGILINGTFRWAGGNYTFDFIDTNAPFQYYTAPTGIPGYDLFILISIISVLSLIFVIKKRKK